MPKEFIAFLMTMTPADMENIAALAIANRRAQDGHDGQEG
jgi:hypothetical protein